LKHRLESRPESGRQSPPALRSRLAVLAGVVLLAATWTGSAAPSGRAAVVKPHQKLTILRTTHKAYARPDARSASLGLVPARRPITNGPTVLHVLGQRIGGGQLQWVRVRLPGRPNGHTGWIRGRGTRAAVTPWHVVVSTSARRVRVYRAGRVVRVFKAIVGKPSTPTPLGTSFVEESIAVPGGAVGGPFALALGSRSTVLQQFAGGPGQIALHGLWNVGGTLGTAASHGCVRLDTTAMRWLAARIGPGVPVTVTR
jgi:lipoprotein-anchoring transpeptidase ErfK/SrfK